MTYEGNKPFMYKAIENVTLAKMLIQVDKIYTRDEAIEILTLQGACFNPLLCLLPSRLRYHIEERKMKRKVFVPFDQAESGYATFVPFEHSEYRLASI